LRLEPKSKILCYVTDRKALGRDAGEADLLEPIRNAAAAGVSWIQIREKDLPGQALLELTRASLSACGDRTRIVVNDRLDVALAAGAAGVHLGRESAPAGEVKRWCLAGHAPPGFWHGVSCHHHSEAVEAERSGADYIFFGPVFETPSKLRHGSPQGIGMLTEVCRSVCIPVIAIGGITTENAKDCFQSGAAGIAAIRLFQQAEDPAAVVSSLGKLN
jgi:thiamine-phosphate pyrophosphorylase